MATSNLQTRQQLDEIDAILQRMLSLPVGSTEEPPLEVNTPRSLPPVVPPMSSVPLPQTWPATLPHLTLHQPTTPTPPEPTLRSWRMEWPAQNPQPTSIPAPPQAPSEVKEHSAPDDGTLPWAVPMVSDPSSTPQTPGLITYNPERPVAPTTAYTPSIYGGMPTPTSPNPVYYNPSASNLNSGSNPASPQVLPTPSPALHNAYAKAVVVPTPLWVWPFIGVNRVIEMVLMLFGPLGAWAKTSTGRNTLGVLGIAMILGAAGWAAKQWFGFDWPR